MAKPEPDFSNPKELKDKIPECCGEPVEIFELLGKGKGDWVAHCTNCWDGTSLQNSREAAIEAWKDECI